MDDPNNHAPELSPDDDWDDMIVVSDTSKTGLPSRKNDRSSPEQREIIRDLAKPRNSDRKTVKPKAEEAKGRVDKDSVSAPLPKQVMNNGASKAAKKIPAKAPKKTALTIANNDTGKSGDKKPSAKAIADNSQVLPLTGISQEPESTAGEALKVILPGGSPTKRSRIHEIGSGDRSKNELSRAAKMTPIVAKTISEEDQEEGPMVRRRIVHAERVDWGEGKGLNSLGWLVLAGIGVLLLVVAAVILSQRSGKKARKSDKPLYSQMDPTNEEFNGLRDELEMFELLTNSQETARRQYALYATSDSLEKIESLVFLKDSVLPLMKEKWKPLGMKPGWMPGDEALWKVLDEDGLRYAVLEGTNSDFTPFISIFRSTDEGLKLDWKASSGYGTAEFEEMKAGAGNGSEIRTWISKAGFFTFSLPEEKFHSFRLLSPKLDMNIWGYTERGSELDEKLMELFMPKQITGEVKKEVQVILEIKPGSDDLLPNQWMIRKLIQVNWLDGVTAEKN
ncbi:MAG: hypothetical protein H7Y36_01325 [Armatimonadetes bacterium]|nr:hypothetical protein [Akkermansiaceae bacterium]